MEFMCLLETLGDFLYEVMTWLVFYPRTMWKTIRHPVEMLHYSDRELDEAMDGQFRDAFNPPRS